MKKIYLLLIALFALNFANAQYTIDFDSFTTGDVTPQTTHLILWPDPSATEPQVTTAQSFSPPHSMMVRANGGGISDDVLFQLGNKTTGTWVAEWWMYVPTGNNGYFNIQENESAVPSQWNGEFYVDQSTAGGSPGVVTHNPTSSTVAYPNDVWFQVMVTVDLDNSLVSVMIDGNSLFQNIVYQGTSSQVANQFGAVDFYSSDANTTFYVDDFFFHEICYPSGSPSLDTLTDTTADISWTASPNETNGYSWLLMADGDDPDTGTPLQSGTTSSGVTTTSFSGLSPNTAYDFYLQADCAALGTSLYVLLEFATELECSIGGVVSTFPFTEGFEPNSTSIGCWEQIHELGAADWVFAEGSSLNSTIATAYSGVQNARFVSENDTASPVTKLVSPSMDLTSLSNPELSFYYAQENWQGDYNHLKVYYRGSETDAWVELAHYSTSMDTWTQEIISLPNPTATYQIAFEGINYFGHANVVDEVVVDEGLSVASQQVFEGFSFYPNPVGDELFLSSASFVDKVIVHNLLGQKMIVSEFTYGEKASINTSNLPKGVYLLQVFSNESKRVFKFLKK